MAKSDYLETLVLEWMRGTAFPAVPTLHLALSTGDPGDDGAGLAEPVGGYARQTIAFDAVTQASGRAQMISSALVTFPTATANWGTITHAAIFDALSGGNMLYHGPLAAPRPVDSGGSISFAAGAVIVEES